MKAPLSWLKEYTNIKLSVDTLMWKMTEVGLTCEFYEKVGTDKILDIEVTPNRPDWLSITGIAREISIIQNTPFKTPPLFKIPKAKSKLPIDIKIRTKLTGGYSGIVIQKVSVKPSPKWMQEKLISVGLRPINNLVDITNYVMFELGIPIHVFDYDKFLTTNLSMELSRGGEIFTSVDGLKYTLFPNTLIIKDKERVIDLCGIKGSLNTGIIPETKNIFIHTPIYDGGYIRKASQGLKLASDASYIYERNPNPRGIPATLARVVQLTLELAGGEIASDVIEIKNYPKKENVLSLNFNDITRILGFTVKEEKIVDILEKLGFKIKVKGRRFECEVPNHRSDISILEDITEEVARIYGYNKIQRTIPRSKANTENIPYKYNRDFELLVKGFMEKTGFMESNTLSLTSKDKINKSNLMSENHLRIANPVSSEFEYLRTSILPNLIEAVKLNVDREINLFEYGKTYFPPVDNSKEPYKIAAVSDSLSFREMRGIIESLLLKLNIHRCTTKTHQEKQGIWHPGKTAVLLINEELLGYLGEISPEVLANFGVNKPLTAFEIDIALLYKNKKLPVYKPIPKHPPQIEDITIKIPKGVMVGDIMQDIKSSSILVSDVELKDIYNDSYTFRISYQHPNKTLTDREVEDIRKQILTKVKVYIPEVQPHYHPRGGIFMIKLKGNIEIK